MQVAKQYHLNTEKLLVETFVPRTTAIFVENVDGNEFRIHINLQENRIISAKQLNAKEADKNIIQKYLEYMK